MIHAILISVFQLDQLTDVCNVLLLLVIIIMIFAIFSNKEKSCWTISLRVRAQVSDIFTGCKKYVTNIQLTLLKLVLISHINEFIAFSRYF